MEALLATLVHNPYTLAKIYKEQFVDKINDRAVNYFPSEDPYAYNFKRRFKAARRIPSSFVKEDEENGYIVLSSDFKRRYWKADRTRFHYLVYRTRFGFWICTCQDYAFNIPKPCKHIIRCVLYKHGWTDDMGSGLSGRLAVIFEDKDGTLQSIVNYG